MTNRLISIILVLSMAPAVTGCEAIQRKFTRKKKREVLRPRFYQEGEADTRPHLELYIMHYTLWRSWQTEILTGTSENTKRNRMSCNEIIGHLQDMKKHLVEEKAEELQLYINEVEKVTEKIKSGGFTVMQMGHLKHNLEKLGARIERKFFYKDVKEYIRSN